MADTCYIQCVMHHGAGSTNTLEAQCTYHVACHTAQTPSILKARTRNMFKSITYVVVKV